MPHDDPKPRPASWRDLGGEQPAATPGKRGWQQLEASSRDQPRPPWSKRTKLLFAGVLLGLVAGGIAIVLQYIKPTKPACIVLVGSGYETNLLLPPNVAGWQGLQNVKNWADGARQEPWLWFFDSSTRVRLVAEPTELKLPKTWKNVVEGLPRGFQEKTVLIYLSLHGGADDQGAYLLTDDEAGQSKTYVNTMVNDVLGLDALKSKNVVLVLDAPHVQTHWPIGMFQNDFVARLKEQWAKTGGVHPNLFVLLACDVDQVSWASEKWQSTMFAHYFKEGLRGGADHDKNGRISLKELAVYLQTKVGTWVESNRNVKQTPVLLGDLARSDDVDLVELEGEYTDDSQAPGKESFTPSEELKGTWAEWDQLKAGAPWTFAPHLWRCYQDAMLRLECLERFGDPTKKRANLKSTLAQVKSSLDSLVPLDAARACAGNSIPLMGALGFSSMPADDAKKLFGDLRDKRDKAAAWAALKDKTKALPQGLPPQLGQMVLDDLLDKNKDLLLADIRKAATWWKLEVEDNLGGQRPVELQFAAMLARDGEFAPGPLLHQALKTRRLAEKAVLGQGKPTAKADGRYPYSEFIYPWVAAKVNGADQSRRRGEDWVFGSKKEHWDNAEKLLKAAEGQYLSIQKDAAVVRLALATRDLAWADLPALAQWLAMQPTVPDGQQTLQSLANNLDRLTRHLTTAGNAQAALDDNPPITLDALAHKVADQHAALMAQYLKQCTSLGELNIVVQHQFYHDMEAVLSVPLMDAGKRETLIRASRAINWKLDSGTAKLDRVVGVGEKPADRVARHEALAQAVYKSCLDEVREKTLAAALPRLPAAIQNSLDDSLDKTDLELAAKELVAGAQLCRLLPGGLALAVNDKARPYAPPQGLRTLHMYQCLKSQAERTLQDHYWEVKMDAYDTSKNDLFNDLAEIPFYVTAAKSYANSAEKLAEGRAEASNPVLHRGRMQAMKDLDKQFVAAGITVPPVPKVFWTTEQKMNLRWSVVADAGVPTGTPMYWHEADEQASAKSAREPIAPWSMQSTLQTTVADDWLKAGDRPDMRIRLTGLFRGQRFGGKASTIVLERRQADIMAQYFQPPPQVKAGVAVRMSDKFTYGAVSIVVDTSGSMTTVFPDGKGKTRFAYALEAVKKVLTDLPDDTYLSVLRFKTKPGDKETGVQFVKLVNVAEVQKWDANRRDALMEELERSDLKNNSPIVKAIDFAARNGFPEAKNYDGPKVVLVLTDGADNESIKQVKTDYDAEISERLAAISNAHLDVQVVVVCFLPKGDAEEPAARKQFEIVNSFGVFKLESDGRMLPRTLENLLRPRLTLDPKQKGFPLTVNLAASSTLDWQKVDPGFYKTTVQAQPTDLLNPLGGNNLFLEVRQKNRKVVLERGIVGRQKELAHADKEQSNDWLATLFENSPGHSFEQVVLLEKTTPTLPIKQVRPALVWLEMEPVKGQAPSLLRWHNDWNIAAPAYRLRADDWPNDPLGNFQVPRLKAWWVESLNEQSAHWQLAKGLQERGGGFKGLHTQGAVESVKVEDHEIEVAPNKTAMRKCLVFRVQHTPNKRVWIRYTGKQPIDFGEEHRYFTDAGKYTATFYPFIQGAVDIGDFELICLTSFKETALDKTFTPAHRIDPVSIFYHRLDDDR